MDSAAISASRRSEPELVNVAVSTWLSCLSHVEARAWCSNRSGRRWTCSQLLSTLRLLSTDVHRTWPAQPCRWRADPGGRYVLAGRCSPPGAGGDGLSGVSSPQAARTASASTGTKHLERSIDGSTDHTADSRLHLMRTAGHLMGGSGDGGCSACTQVYATGFGQPVAFVRIRSTGRRLRGRAGGAHPRRSRPRRVGAGFPGSPGGCLVRRAGPLGLAFPPDAAASGRFFVNFTDRPATRSLPASAAHRRIRWSPTRRAVSTSGGTGRGA